MLKSTEFLLFLNDLNDSKLIKRLKVDTKQCLNKIHDEQLSILNLSFLIWIL